MEKNNITILDMDSSLYPEKLRRISKPPKQLYCVGNLALLSEPAVSVVGSRRYSLYGKQTAEMIGRHLAENNLTVVSGLAFGIDAFSHEGTLRAGGKAIAVLGTGLDHFYPKRNTELFHRICREGLVITEYEPAFTGSRYSFPARNRIISALGDCLVVVEAGSHSGALITAQYALEQGKDVYAVPGNINSQFSMGTNLLIRDGAIPLVILDDLIRNLGKEPEENAHESLEPLGADEQLVVDLLEEKGGLHVNEISRILNRTAGSVSAIITILEIKGIVVTCAGRVQLVKYS